MRRMQRLVGVTADLKNVVTLRSSQRSAHLEFIELNKLLNISYFCKCHRGWGAVLPFL